MHFNIAALSFFAAAAAAQSTDSNTSTSNESLAQLISQLPACARECYTSAAKSAECSITDFECICITNRPAFIGSIAPCVLFSSSCSSTEKNDATAVATDFCHKMYASPNATEIAAASSVAVSLLGTTTSTASAGSSDANSPGSPAARPAVGLGLGLIGAAVLAAVAL